MEQREMARWLRAIDVIATTCCVLMAFAVAPLVLQNYAGNYPEQMAVLYWPVLAFFWMSVLPMVAICMLAWRVFGRIGRDESFSDANARALKAMGILAFADAALYLAGIAALLCAGWLPVGILLVCATVLVGSLAMAIVCMALSHLTAKAAAIKAENDLTV